MGNGVMARIINLVVDGKLDEAKKLRDEAISAIDQEITDLELGWNESSTGLDRDSNDVFTRIMELQEQKEEFLVAF